MASPIAGNESFTNVENLVGQVQVLDVANLNATTLLSQTETVNSQALLPNVKPSLEGLTVNPELGIESNYLPGINRTPYDGSSGSDIILPAATVGTVVVHLQTVDTNGGGTTLEFDCAGSDVIATGSVIETRTDTGAVDFNVSTKDQTKLTFTAKAGGVTTNLLTAGNMIYFWCTKAGEWHVAADLSTDVLATTGEFEFAA